MEDIMQRNMDKYKKYLVQWSLYIWLSFIDDQKSKKYNRNKSDSIYLK